MKNKLVGDNIEQFAKWIGIDCKETTKGIIYPIVGTNTESGFLLFVNNDGDLDGALKEPSPHFEFVSKEEYAKQQLQIIKPPIDPREILMDFIRWFRTHPEYENITETPLAELYVNKK